jgi:hypothetical protein
MDARNQIEAGITQALKGMGVTPRSVAFQDAKISVRVAAADKATTASVLKAAGVKGAKAFKAHDGDSIFVIPVAL